MKVIAIITARGGSKRIPRKNIKSFCGQPIIKFSIDAAIKSQLFDEVMVSTDDAEIAEIATKCGAKVPFLRSAKTSDDFSTTTDVLNEVLEAYSSSLKRDFDYFACIYPTAPFVTPQKLKSAFERLIQNDADSIITAVKYSFPPQRSFTISNGLVKYRYPEFVSSRSQDLEPVYHDCGQFYFCKTSAFLESSSLVTENTIAFEVPEEESQDIDTLSDWNIAEIKYENFQRGNNV